jgi:hypothetical protein
VALNRRPHTSTRCWKLMADSWRARLAMLSSTPGSSCPVKVQQQQTLMSASHSGVPQRCTAGDAVQACEGIRRWIHLQGPQPLPGAGVIAGGLLQHSHRRVLLRLHRLQRRGGQPQRVVGGPLPLQVSCRAFHLLLSLLLLLLRQKMMEREPISSRSAGLSTHVVLARLLVSTDPQPLTRCRSR